MDFSGITEACDPAENCHSSDSMLVVEDVQYFLHEIRVAAMVALA